MGPIPWVLAQPPQSNHFSDGAAVSNQKGPGFRKRHASSLTGMNLSASDGARKSAASLAQHTNRTAHCKAWWWLGQVTGFAAAVRRDVQAPIT